MTHFAWDVSQEQREFRDFYAALIHFRKACPLLGRDDFLRPDDITWHEDDWGNEGSKFLAFTLHGGCAALAAPPLRCCVDGARPVCTPLERQRRHSVLTLIGLGHIRGAPRGAQGRGARAQSLCMPPGATTT